MKEDQHNTLIDGITTTGILSMIGVLILVVGIVGSLTQTTLTADGYGKLIYAGLIIQAFIVTLKPHLIWRVVGACAFSIISALLIIIAIEAGKSFFKT